MDTRVSQAEQDFMDLTCFKVDLHALTNSINRATARYQVWTRLGQCKAAFQEQCCDQTTTANTTHERTNRKHFARHKHKAAARARAERHGHVGAWLC